MKVIDSHLHLWDPSLLSYEWLHEVPTLNRPFLPGELAAETLAPRTAIVVQADCAVYQAMDEVLWINQLAETSPIHIAGIVAWAELECGDAVIPYLRQLREIPRVVGIRRSLQNEPVALFYDESYRKGLLAATREGFVIDICVRANQLQATYDLLDWLFNHAPDASVVLDHMGKPAIVSDEWQEWKANLDVLASFPQLVCKISGLPTEADWDTWTTEELKPWIQHAVEVFGPQRCLFGGDWPVVNLACGYSRWLQCVETAISDLSFEEKSAVMADNASKIYLAQTCLRQAET